MRKNQSVIDELLMVLKPHFEEREAMNIIHIYLEDMDIDFSTFYELKLVAARKDMQKIINGMPISYITGRHYFFEHFFKVNPRVLIPRPETEELCAVILKENHNHSLKAIEVGVGSGCIAISLAKKRPQWKLVGLDISPEAIEIAKENASLLNADISLKVQDFLIENEWEDLGSFDLIISNPPYIAKEERDKMSFSTLKYEPDIALFSPSLDIDIFYRKLAIFGLDHLNASGRVYAEMNEFRSEEIKKIFLDLDYDVKLIQDMQGKKRIIVASKQTK